MVNPYQSYIQMLIPLLANSEGVKNDDCESGVATEDSVQPQITISICVDNPRSLSDDLSMTMKALKPSAAKMNRWSSVPDLKCAKSITGGSSTKKSTLRSTDDLRSLMKNNSRIPRSTDNLRGTVSTGSLNRQPRKDDGSTPPRQNDRWENKSQKKQSKNPFDLRMAGLPVPATGTRASANPGGSVLTSTGSLRLPLRTDDNTKPLNGNDRWENKSSIIPKQQQQTKNPFDTRIPTHPVPTLDLRRHKSDVTPTTATTSLSLSLKIPKRQTSMDPVRRDLVDVETGPSHDEKKEGTEPQFRQQTPNIGGRAA